MRHRGFARLIVLAALIFFALTLIARCDIEHTRQQLNHTRHGASNHATKTMETNRCRSGNHLAWPHAVWLGG
jgi:sulfite exporter TauE/SafE